MVSRGKTIDVRYSEVFKKVILCCRVYDKDCDTEIESGICFTEKELREVIDNLQAEYDKLQQEKWMVQNLMENNG